MICKSTGASSIIRFKTLEADFIKVHNNKYDYTNSEFTTMLTKIRIVCPIHGIFFKAPAKHLQGQGCPICSSARKAAGARCSTSEFIRKAVKIAPQYDYSKVTYIQSSEKVVVICKEHGEFLISPNKLLSGRGCPKCKPAKIAKALTKPLDVVLTQLQDKYKGAITIDPETYINAKAKVTAYCNIHGKFSITLDTLLNKTSANCPACSRRLQADYKRKSLYTFIEQASAVHNYKYTYEQVIYRNSRTDVDITCPEHGVFKQAPSNHLAGIGCSICTVTYNYTDLPTTLYFVRIQHPTSKEQVYKVGITTKSIQCRFAAELSKGYTIDIIAIYQFLTGKTAFSYEQMFLRKHKAFLRKDATPYLINSSGDSELFTCNVLKDFHVTTISTPISQRSSRAD